MYNPQQLGAFFILTNTIMGTVAITDRFTSGVVWKFYENVTPVTIAGLNGQNLPSENHKIRLIQS